jgi:hypothetical protein
MDDDLDIPALRDDNDELNIVIFKEEDMNEQTLLPIIKVHHTTTNTRSQWDTMFFKLKQHKEEHGNGEQKRDMKIISFVSPQPAFSKFKTICAVGISQKSKEHPKLASWLASQKRQMMKFEESNPTKTRKGSMTKEKIKKMKALGVQP